MENQEQKAPVQGFPRRIGICNNEHRLVEVRFEYAGAFLAIAMVPAEARDLAKHLVGFADLAEAPVTVEEPTEPPAAE